MEDRLSLYRKVRESQLLRALVDLIEAPDSASRTHLVHNHLNFTFEKLYTIY